MFELAPLPFAEDALEPFLSAEAVNLHHDKHHRGYVEKLNQLLLGSAMERQSLETIMSVTYHMPEMEAIFNNAGQVWNHNFFWVSITPGSGPVTAAVKGWMARDFGGYDRFKDAFVEAAISQFGSGWAWLVLSADGSLKVTSTANAESPLLFGETPLLTCDVWEHAYYLDYRNRRRDFVAAFLDDLANWDFVTFLLDQRTTGISTQLRR